MLQLNEEEPPKEAAKPASVNIKTTAAQPETFTAADESQNGWLHGVKEKNHAPGSMDHVFGKDVAGENYYNTRNGFIHGHPDNDEDPMPSQNL